MKSFNLKHRATLTAAFLAGFAMPASAASDYYLQIDTIQGEATDKMAGGAKAQEIEVQSFSWGVSQASTPRDASSGMASGKRMHKPMTISKPLDRQGSVTISYNVISPRDAASGMATGRSTCATGKHIASASLSGKTQRWNLHNVVISACTPDSMTLDYQTLTVDPQG